MARLPNRDPRAPRLACDLERPEAARDVFVDGALTEGLLLEGVQFVGIDAEEVELKRFVVTEVDLSGAKLDGLDLEDGSIKACNLASLRSDSCTIERVVIEASRLTGAALVKARLMDVVFRDSPIDMPSFRFGRFDRVRFESCRLIEADLQGVTARACSFIDCDLSGAQLSQGSFAGSAFRGCRLAGVKGLEALKDTQMACQDVMEIATALAASLGIEIRDDIY
jgi:uncharacterized protein YjbI with pentapeptide repeats